MFGKLLTNQKIAHKIVKPYVYKALREGLKTHDNGKIQNLRGFGSLSLRFSSAFKAEVAVEAIKGLKTISELAQEYELHPAQITQWKKQFLDQSASVFESDKKKNEELDQLKKELHAY